MSGPTKAWSKARLLRHALAAEETTQRYREMGNAARSELQDLQQRAKALEAADREKFHLLRERNEELADLRAGVTARLKVSMADLGTVEAEGPLSVINQAASIVAGLVERGARK